ncbi:hypothetical protein RchiOBHm_Chr6g0289721 [Rosa chinensis]|uniref:Uncharacterized protein n=1 Tax=Rosa chinensis TaxID=74649 RepID=A0A2P6PVN9_ROSCH|nr:hypothetical protein RchiOBHm_Chr6g0289721 [Rosa chinensis]
MRVVYCFPLVREAPASLLPRLSLLCSNFFFFDFPHPCGDSHPSGVLISLFSSSFASDFCSHCSNMFLDLRSESLRYTLRFVLMVILSFCSAFAPQDVQTVNKSPSSCLPCPAMEESVLLCNHLFRSQVSLLRSILVWLLLSFLCEIFS